MVIAVLALTSSFLKALLYKNPLFPEPQPVFILLQSIRDEVLYRIAFLFLW